MYKQYVYSIQYIGSWGIRRGKKGMTKREREEKKREGPRPREKGRKEHLGSERSEVEEKEISEKIK